MLLLLKIGFNLSSECKAEALFVAGQSQFSQREWKKKKSYLAKCFLEHQANADLLRWKGKLICKTFEKFTR